MIIIEQYARFVGENTILLAEVPAEDRSHPIGAITHANMEENFQILKNETDQDGRPFNIIRLPLPPLTFLTATPKDSTYQLLQITRFKQEGVVPDGIQDIVCVAPASYNNFLVTNGVVLVAKYHKEGVTSEAFKKADQLAREIIQSAFPEHAVVQIDALNINTGGGGMHCISQQQPAC